MRISVSRQFSLDFRQKWLYLHALSLKQDDLKAVIRAKFNLNKNVDSFSDVLMFETIQLSRLLKTAIDFLSLQYNVLGRSRTLLNETSQYNYLFEDLVVVVLQIVQRVRLVHFLHMLHVPQTVTAERLVRGNVGKTVVAPFSYKKKKKNLTFSDHNFPIRRVNYSRFLVMVLDYYMHLLHVLVIFLQY